MSRATGTAAGGAGAKRSGSARTVTDTAGSRGSGTEDTKAVGTADADGEGGAVSKGGDTKSAGRGKSVTETRGPQPYHPPKAYEPPAERSASDSASGAAADDASGSASESASKNGKAGKPAKAARGSAKATEPAKAAGPVKASGRPTVPEQARPARPEARTAPRTRKARLRVAKADPWSVMKVSFLLSVALGVCTIVAAAVLWTVLDVMGVFSTVGGTISDATGSSEGGGFDLQSFLSLPNVLLFTSVIAVIDVVLATALATLGAFVYNLSAGFVGGVELTLAEDE
ncbi:hypothetical protein FHS39_003082 [Streptomyces olivoverticillatus]|uniref:DUF3566 domain-containing protein n=1 Tax=Streptomyces olivoverticillatus TaxID=66427 RepID=A0A7W7PM26_9ACTN|nr:hypothetical protein [Streptomyces olivoverticillatus]